jgi:fructokinase
LGHNTAFIGKVGNDFFGDQLRADMMLNKTEISEDILKETEMLNFANVAASIITTRKGALRVMPEQEEIQQYLNTIRNANK